MLMVDVGIFHVIPCAFIFLELHMNILLQFILFMGKVYFVFTECHSIVLPGLKFSILLP